MLFRNQPCRPRHLCTAVLCLLAGAAVTHASPQDVGFYGVTPGITTSTQLRSNRQWTGFIEQTGGTTRSVRRYRFGIWQDVEATLINNVVTQIDVTPPERTRAVKLAEALGLGRLRKPSSTADAFAVPRGSAWTALQGTPPNVVLFVNDDEKQYVGKLRLFVPGGGWSAIANRIPATMDMVIGLNVDGLMQNPLAAPLLRGLEAKVPPAVKEAVRGAVDSNDLAGLLRNAAMCVAMPATQGTDPSDVCLFLETNRPIDWAGILNGSKSLRRNVRNGRPYYTDQGNVFFLPISSSILCIAPTESTIRDIQNHDGRHSDADPSIAEVIPRVANSHAWIALSNRVIQLSVTQPATQNDPAVKLLRESGLRTLWMTFRLNGKRLYSSNGGRTGSAAQARRTAQAFRDHHRRTGDQAIRDAAALIPVESRLLIVPALNEANRGLTIRADGTEVVSSTSANVESLLIALKQMIVGVPPAIGD